MAFPTLSVLDDFNRANEGPPPSSNWTDVEGGLEVVSNQVRGDGATGNWENWNVETFGPDCEAFATISTADVPLNVYARLSSVNTNDDGYRLAHYANKLGLWRHDGGSGTQLGSDYSITEGVGDKIGLECIGTTIKGYFKDGAAAWAALITEPDVGGHEGAGYIGMRIYATGKAADDFGGGTIAGGPYTKSAEGPLRAAGDLTRQFKISNKQAGQI